MPIGAPSTTISVHANRTDNAYSLTTIDWSNCDDKYRKEPNTLVLAITMTDIVVSELLDI